MDEEGDDCLRNRGVDDEVVGVVTKYRIICRWDYHNLVRISA